MSFSNAKVVCVGANPVDYHRQDVERGRVEYVMSSSSLREFSRCPERWLAGYESPDSDAKEWGSLLDCRALTPDQFDKRYAVEPLTYSATVMECPSCGGVADSKTCKKCGKARNEVTLEKDWNNNADACKKWRAEQGAKEIVSPKDIAECNAAVERLFQDDVIKAWFDASDRQVWVVAQWTDERTGLTVPLRCLMDFVPRPDTEFGKCLGDMKTTRSGSLIPWQRHCYEMGYHVQAAFNLDLYAAATEEERQSWCFILQENYAPWQPAKRILHPEFVDFGRRKYRAFLASYCWSLKNNKWPGYDDTDEAVQGWSIVQAEPWMESRDVFSPRFESEQYAKTIDEAFGPEESTPTTYAKGSE